MSTLNDYGDGIQVDESIGDVAYDTLEAKAKEEAKDLASDGIEAAEHTTVKALDKMTDKIEPVKTVKDKIKEKLSNNPITRFKAAVKRAKEKIKQGIKKLAREGLHAVGRLAMKGVKALGHLIAAHPIAAAIVFLILLIIMSQMQDNETVDHGMLDENTMDMQGPVFVDTSGMIDNDRVVILMDDCISQQYDVMGELDAEKEELAKKMYSVFRDYGFNNASIAGILGNTDCESGIDPSAIEGIFSEYGFLGTKKAEALLSLTHYTEDILFNKYRDNGVSFNRNGYKVINDDNQEVFYCGVGLAQWTGANCYAFLKAAETLGIDWYDMEYQLGYMISDCMYRPGFFAGWVGNQFEGDPDEPEEPDPNDYATSAEYDEAYDEYEEAYAIWEESWLEAARQSGLKYVHEYEGNTAKDEERKAASVEWYLIIKDWGDDEVDTGYVETITDMAAQLGAITNMLDVELGQYRCLNGNIFDNSSLANAAVSFAWPTKEQSRNNGTNLYQTVHDGIWPRDLIYKACDRCVAMAVLWSGTDDSYPTGTPNQLSYLQSSGKWELVGMSDSLSIGDLAPGDIFIRNGHTWVYVGEEAINKAYTGECTPGSDSVSASLNERSAACGPDTSHCLGNGGKDYEGKGPYYVFRCVSPDNSDTYTHIGSGMTE